MVGHGVVRGARTRRGAPASEIQQQVRGHSLDREAQRLNHNNHPTRRTEPTLMYPHWRALLPQWNPVHALLTSVFSYGFYRGATAQYPPPHDLLSDRLLFGILNGGLYLFPPYGILRLGAAIKRVEVAATQRDPKAYPPIYKEVLGWGHNERAL